MKTRSWSRVRGTKQVSTSAERRRRRNESDAGSRHSLDMSGALGHVEDTYIDRPVVLVFIPTAGKVTCVIVRMRHYRVNLYAIGGSQTLYSSCHRASVTSKW